MRHYYLLRTRNLLAAACSLLASGGIAQKASLATPPYSTLFSKKADAAIFDSVERQTFQYFYNGSEPQSGMARERYHVDGDYPSHDQNVVTSGGSGFGVMALLAGMERRYITREQGITAFEKILGFLERADRFHGVYPHWWNGETGSVRPFSKKDDGGDLVETAYLMQGLLCARQYFAKGPEAEKTLAKRIDKLWRDVEFDWQRHGQNVLYWHWSPKYEWQMNLPIQGYNECLIVYILAASSPTHGVPAEVYHEGWARKGAIRAASAPYNLPLVLAHNGSPVYGGPLFWSQYSYLGLDPHGLKDRYANYWTENQNQSLINYRWCVENPRHFKGYGAKSWGLTASYSVDGYAGHAPGRETDLGVISPTAALASFPYTPRESTAAMRNWFSKRKEQLWGPFGFYDAFSDSAAWYPQRYLAIDQGPAVVMMENYRSGLLWRLFMSCPEVQKGLRKLGFKSPWLR